MINGVIKEVFSDPISKLDQKILGCRTGGSEGQQLWESLTVLVALRLWASYWQGRRVQLRVRGDNVSALIMLVKMKSTGDGMNLIARELALDVAESVYEPSVAEHLPGVTNDMAERHSRLDQHGDSPTPSPLRQASWRTPPRRTWSWWRTL